MRIRLSFVTFALVLAWAPVSPHLVERVYSRGWYSVLQPVLTSVSNLAPVALFDLLTVCLLAAWVARAAMDVGQVGAARAAGRIVLRTLVWSAAAYIVFLGAWGFNYRRLRLRDRLPYDASRVTEAGVVDVLGTAVDRLNALYPHGHEIVPGSPAVDPPLAAAFEDTMRELGVASDVVLARPKSTSFQWFFSRSGIDGMTDPFFLETLVNGDLLPFERPVVIAHEWSHLAGLADEGEASYGGWLACTRASAADQYSAWLFLYAELVRALPVRLADAAAAKLSSGPRDDLRRIRARIARGVSPVLSSASWRVYDSYLKANRVQAGARSYGEVVQLVLGVRLLDQRAGARRQTERGQP